MLKTVQLINTSSFGNGTVTQVQGNGTVNGITLTGNVTTSGNLTLGGALSGIANSQLSNSSVTIGNTTISLGGTATSLGNIALANVSTTGLTGYLYGNNGSGNVTASTTIPNTGLANSTITLGNATLTLGSTTTSVGNLTLNNANITSVASTFPNNYLSNSTATLGNTTITLGSTTSSIGNLTLANVTITSGTENNVTYTNATISSVKTTFPNSFLTNNSVTIGNTSVSLGSTVTSFGNVTLTNATISSLSTPITTSEGGTGLTTLTSGRIPYGNGTSALNSSNGLTFDGSNLSVSKAIFSGGSYNYGSTGSITTSVNVMTIAFGPYSARALKVGVVASCRSGGAGSRVAYLEQLVKETGGNSLSLTSLTNSTASNMAINFNTSADTLTIQVTTSAGVTETLAIGIELIGGDVFGVTISALF